MRPALLLAVTAAAFLAGCGATAPDAPVPSVPTPPAVPAAPTAVTIPALGAHSGLIRTGMTPSGAPETPPVTDPMQASWATWSPEPGTVGPATLLGHVDGEVGGRKGQPGIFNRIDDLTTGDEVVVDRDGAGPARFAVYRVAAYPKSDVPEAQVYGDVPGPELRLVTCGGSFDEAAHSYRDQIVVYARMQS